MLAAGPASSSAPHQAQLCAAAGCRVLSRIAAPRPCRGNPLRSPAAPGSRLLTLPSILRSGFRSLSSPNNAALAKHLPRADRAPAGELAGATRSRSTLPAIVRRGSAALGDKRQQWSSPEESQRCRPQHALKTTTSQPRQGGERGGTLGTMVFKWPTKGAPLECSCRGEQPQHLDGSCGPAAEASGCRDRRCSAAWCCRRRGAVGELYISALLQKPQGVSPNWSKGTAQQNPLQSVGRGWQWPKIPCMRWLSTVPGFAAHCGPPAAEEAGPWLRGGPGGHMGRGLRHRPYRARQSCCRAGSGSTRGSSSHAALTTSTS